MAFYHGSERNKTNYRHREDEDFGNMYRLEGGSPRLDQEKKLRREIANSNERRRMQSINAGFQSLRALLPKGEGDKLSKAAILQGTVDYVQMLEQEKTFLLSQNMKLSRSAQSSNDSDGSCSDLPLPKRKRRKTELVSHLIDEGIGSASPSSQSENEDVRHEIAQLRKQLEQERSWRLRLEKELLEKEAKKKSEPLDHDYTDQEEVKMPSDLRTLPTFSTLSRHHPEEDTLLRQRAVAVVQNYPYASSKPRQNLAAIVEAIRHVEGFDMFQDDPAPTLPEDRKESLSFESQIIRSAPVVQNRAGVIVSNTS